ncbi:MAG: glycosyltransferase [Chitinophagaceae bacterium]|nr:glycosyltransferase [Chitinophagaceae bacterium]
MNDNFLMSNQGVSVCLACYNGEKFIVEQLNSILQQLRKSDEVIVIDDGSTDKTVEKILNQNDQRVILIKNQSNLGVNRSFELAIELAKNEVIVLSDQDDIWIDGRLKLILTTLNINTASLVAGNSIYIDNNGIETKPLIGNLKKNESKKFIVNLFRIFNGTAPYYGCTMAFSKDLKSLILPFPKNIESHDLWIAKCAIIINRIMHIEEPILYRRIHGGNASIVSRKLTAKIYSRIIFFTSIIIIFKRIIKNRLCKFY